MTDVINVTRSAGSSRFAGVDVLRGVSVLLVVLHHINLRFLLNQLPDPRLSAKVLGAVHFGEITIEGAKGNMTALTRYLENEDVGEAHALVAPILLDGSLDDLMILDCEVLVVEQHFNRAGNFLPRAVVDRVQHP